jgi:hypothetical protein
MTHCRKCEHLRSNADTTVRCELTGHTCYLDDLPLTVMDDCPLKDDVYDNANRCVCCNAVIPEGRQICPNCERGG